MKANLNELRELVLFTEDSNNPLTSAMVKFMFSKVVEPIQQGVYESNEIDEYFFQTKEDILKGFDYLDAIETDFTEEYEINL